MPTLGQSVALMEKIERELSDVLEFEEPSEAVRMKEKGEMYRLHMKGKGSGPKFQIVWAPEVISLFVEEPENIPEEYFKVLYDEVHPTMGYKAIKLTKIGFLDAEGNITEIKGWACIFHTPAEKQIRGYTYRSYEWTTRSCDQLYAIIKHLARAVVMPRYSL